MERKRVYPSLNIPKKHTLRHYAKLVCKLYSEPEETIEETVEAVVVENEHNLDKAIECFKGLLPDSERERLERESRVQGYFEEKK